jgi:hypothetical protein
MKNCITYKKRGRKLLFFQLVILFQLAIKFTKINKYKNK